MCLFDFCHGAPGKILTHYEGSIKSPLAADTNRLWMPTVAQLVVCSEKYVIVGRNRDYPRSCARVPENAGDWTITAHVERLG